MKKIILVSLVVLITAGIIFSIWFLRTGGDTLLLKNVYMSEVQSELEKVNYSKEVFTEDDIASLPGPVQRYFRYCGYIGERQMSTVRIFFDDADFVQQDKTIKLDSVQYNFVKEPARIVYLNSKLMGVIPFEGRDKYQNGKGAMTGKLMKVINLFDETGKEMDQSAMVTFMAEILVLPTCVLQDYLQWEEIDKNRAKVIMEYDGYRAEGIYTFNDKGEAIRFETDDRYMDKGDGVFEKEKWVVEMSDYVDRGGIKVPLRLRAIWKLEEGDLVYFDGTINEIEFDIE